MVSFKEIHHNSIWAKKDLSLSGLNSSNSSVLSLLPKVFSVLDVGCGKGDLMIELKARGIKSEGVDVSGVSLKVASSKGLKVKKADLDLGLPYKSSSFDCVICNQVLMHIIEPESLVKEMSRVSRKYVLINVTNHLNWRFRLSFLLGNLPEVLSEDHSHIRLFSLARSKKIILNSNLKIVTEGYTGKRLFPSFLSTGFTFLCVKK